jgi:hypothetical protein
MAKTKAPTNIRAEQQIRQFDYVHDNLNKEVISKVISDQFYNQLKNVGDGFRATVLGFKEVSIIGDADALRRGKRYTKYVYAEETDDDDTPPNSLQGNYFVVYIKPEFDFINPDPVTLPKGPRAQAIKAFPIAISNQVLGNTSGDLVVKPGDIVKVTPGTGTSILDDLSFSLPPVDFDSRYATARERRKLKDKMESNVSKLTSKTGEPEKNPKGQWADKNKVDINYSMNPIFSFTGNHSTKTRPVAEDNMKVTLELYKKMKEKLDFPLRINDAIPRNPSSRDSKGTSRHFYGCAIDISFRGLTRKQTHEMIRAGSEVGFLTLGFSDTYVHFQWEPKDQLAKSRPPPYTWGYGNAYTAGAKVSDLKKWTKKGGAQADAGSNPYPNVSSPDRLAASK